jgi:hypothetical protein
MGPACRSALKVGFLAVKTDVHKINIGFNRIRLLSGLNSGFVVSDFSVTANPSLFLLRF